METGHFLMLFVTVLISSTVSSSEDHVFVQTGDSIKLDLKNKTLPKFDKLSWTYESKNIVRFFNKIPIDIKPHSSYKDRVDFNNQTFSLTLRNMQTTDNGVYTAKTIGEQETNVATLNVSVIDAVDSPVLDQNFTMITVDSCIVDVECIAPILTLSSTFHSINCSQEEVTSSGIQTLNLYCIRNIVVCNYSNPVSWRNETIDINQLCTPNERQVNVTAIISVQNPKEENSFPLHWLLMIIAIVAVLVCAMVFIIWCSYKKRKKDDQQTEQTVYAQVQPKTEVQRPLETLAKSENPQTVYGVLGEQKQTDSSQTMPEIKDPRENLPSTTYSKIGEHQTPMKPFPTGTENTIYSTVCKRV